MELLHTSTVPVVNLLMVLDPTNTSARQVFPLFSLCLALFPPVEGSELARVADFVGGFDAVEVSDGDFVVEAGHIMFNKFHPFKPELPA